MCKRCKIVKIIAGYVFISHAKSNVKRFQFITFNSILYLPFTHHSDSIRIWIYHSPPCWSKKPNIQLTSKQTNISTYTYKVRFSTPLVSDLCKFFNKSFSIFGNALDVYSFCVQFSLFSLRLNYLSNLIGK